MAQVVTEVPVVTGTQGVTGLDEKWGAAGRPTVTATS